VMVRLVFMVLPAVENGIRSCSQGRPAGPISL
jgi:hypothetical protein